ncbi:DUF3570 domain-containing protein [Thalassolituus marinus]|uniref:DUF3570 domain-containing protein n=1 Tax=Thalassolituus marinus TaxID=671053 RepID=A0ABS7ZTI7_9GAMM|nr:DUF3570 domain-containing protein [Thalassolituus marinus]MCA6064994.1 DUF3570 domain-containing protein [Thalassolituus marinus]
MSKSTRNSLAALAAAAATMPAFGEAAPTEQVAAYRFSQYNEADAPLERTQTGVTERYSIDIHQFRYSRPLADDWYLNSEFQYETLSGASPMHTYENADGRSALVMSGASIDETRYDLKVAPKRYFSGAMNGQIDGTLGGLAAISIENDYRSLALGVDGSLELFNKHTTLNGSLSMSLDELSPTDADISADRSRADGRGKRSVSLYEGITQIIDKNRVIQVGLGYTRLSGYLSDPYRWEDRRPGQRDQLTVTAQYRQFMPLWGGAAIHGDYRYYSDNWGIRSHTLTARWAQNLNMAPFSFQLTPMLRYYRQTAAEFYSLEFSPPQDQYNSSDYRLSSYGAFAYGLESRARYYNWTLSIDWQQYFSGENFALVQSTDDETPALVDYSIISLGIEYKY